MSKKLCLNAMLGLLLSATVVTADGRLQGDSSDSGRPQDRMRKRETNVVLAKRDIRVQYDTPGDSRDSGRPQDRMVKIPYVEPQRTHHGDTPRDNAGRPTVRDAVRP